MGSATLLIGLLPGYAQAGWFAPLGFTIVNGLIPAIKLALPSTDPTRPSDAFLEWAWRIPLLFSAVMVIVGFSASTSVVESDAFPKVVAAEQGEKLPLATVITSNWRALIRGAFTPPQDRGPTGTTAAGPWWSRLSRSPGSDC